MGALVDSIVKGDSFSLSEEEFNSEKFSLNFCFRKPYALFVFPSSYAPPHIMESNLFYECTKVENHLPWLWRGYITSILVLRARFWASAKFCFF